MSEMNKYFQGRAFTFGRDEQSNLVLWDNYGYATKPDLLLKIAKELQKTATNPQSRQWIMDDREEMIQSEIKQALKELHKKEFVKDGSKGAWGFRCAGCSRKVNSKMDDFYILPGYDGWLYDVRFCSETCLADCLDKTIRDRKGID